ncbi:MAG: S1 family peptidase [Chloroflexota bacterium]
MHVRVPLLIRLAALVLVLAGLGPSPALLSRANAAPVESEIVGGKKVRQGEDSFMVVIRFSSGSGVFQCSGTLLDPTHVLTAAHCVTDGSALYTGHVVYYGSVRFSTARSVAASVATPHPGFDPMRLRNDVAVLKLDAPVSGPNVAFVRLPVIGSHKYEKAGTEVVASGWGATSESGGPVNDLREAPLQIVAFNQCKGIWKMAGLTLGGMHVCAWAANKDTCFGDSGGPLFARTANEVVQVGITSFGYGCGTVVPGVYTRLSNQAIGSFIRRMLHQ